MKTMKKLGALLLCLTMIAAAFAGCAAGGSGGTLRVATSPDFAPMEFIDASKEGQDKYVGFDITLAKYLADGMNMKLEIVPMSFEACQVAVSTGNVDMAISGFSWLQEREENYNLSDFYQAGDNETEQILICMAEKGDAYANAPEIDDQLTVGVQAASLQAALVAEQLPDAQVVTFVDLTTGLLQLRNGDFDVMAVAAGNGDALIANNPDIGKTGFEFEVDPKYTDNLILLQKGNDDLTKKVNDLLAKAKSEGKYPGWYDEAKELANIGTGVSYDDEGNEITD